MKKLVIAASSVALAAMPVVGVFAADKDLTQTDTVIVTVDTACSLATSGSSLDPASTYRTTIANGQADTNITGSTFTVTCNDDGGWEMYAYGSGTSTDQSQMTASTSADDNISTGTTLDGSVSDWAFKVAGANGATIQGSYGNFSLIPNGETNKVKIAKGTTTTTTATVSATYGVGISSTQEAGTYTGKVSYLLAHPATN